MWKGRVSRWQGTLPEAPSLCPQPDAPGRAEAALCPAPSLSGPHRSQAVSSPLPHSHCRTLEPLLPEHVPDGLPTCPPTATRGSSSEPSSLLNV